MPITRYSFIDYNDSEASDNFEVFRFTKFEVNRILSLFRDIAKVLADVHSRNIFHLNLCPQNILTDGKDFIIVGW